MIVREDGKLVRRSIGDTTFYGYGDHVTLDPYYAEQFSQGADIMPQTLFFVDIDGPLTRPILKVRTSKEERENPLAKKAKEVDVSGSVEKNYVYWTLKSEDLVPFIVQRYRPVVLPMKVKGAAFNLVGQNEIKADGHKHAHQWFHDVQEAAIRAKTVKGADRTLDDIREPLRTRNKLEQQDPSPEGYLVFMGAGGKNVCAACVPVSTVRPPFVNHQTTYMMITEHEEEAWYVVGMLNSRPVNDAIKESQPEGQQGQQHVHERAFIFPMFDSNDPAHQQVAALAKKIGTGLHSSWSADPTAFAGQSLQARRRAAIKKLTDDWFRDVDDLNDAASLVLDA